MTDAAKALMEQLAKLPIEDRAELAAFLLESLEEPRDPMSDADFKKELYRRWRQIESGEEKGVPAEVVFRRLREKYG